MSKHTPGPWDCFYKHKYDEWHVSLPVSSGSMKWALFDDGVRSENPEADARLISAAPELLEALQNMIRMAAPHFSDETQMLCLRLANQAISKALGDSK